ncbi:zinc finger MYND domain-containing protein [Phanerochaete sordida]|uniref:Zinc finger MYND domain-containing protein n=1 Tax=Phanerochaete sordida TaxID=48140 RepID=A0A9P3LGG8_9APHY|nr:zinc finger MYND domain-containing protein [Phanerochaete sordida]
MPYNDLRPEDIQRLLSRLTPEAFFGSIVQKAHMLEQLERSGKPIPENIEFGITHRCAKCDIDIEPPRKIMRCSACKAVVYCSQKCSSAAWTNPPYDGFPPHKVLCPTNKRHMQRMPEAHAILKSFPWGRLEKDDTFCLELARGRFDVLGNTDFGFWSQRGGPASHAFSGDGGDALHALAAQGGASRLIAQQLGTQFTHLDGHDLLHRKRHLADEPGWRLERALIPYRDIGQLPLDRRPVLVTEFDGGVDGWDAWYRWRKLPKRSPAALLMHVPLSVYHIVTKVLKLTNPAVGSLEKRVKLCLHLIGAEVELNFLPLFSELALLLPYHDITIVVFGHGVQKLFDAAKDSGLGSSPLKQSIAKKGPVFEYAAPEALGGGTVAVHLHRASPLWNEEQLFRLKHSQPELAPDALVALDAGLASYREWWEVIFVAHRDNIPFAVTEYAEQSLEFALETHIPAARRGLPPRSYAIALNPFHRPGQRQIPTYRMPNLVNGFTLAVVDKIARIAVPKACIPDVCTTDLCYYFLYVSVSCKIYCSSRSKDALRGRAPAYPAYPSRLPSLT